MQKLITTKIERGLFPVSAFLLQFRRAMSYSYEQSQHHIRTIMLLTASSFMLLGSCATPITIGPDHFGIGLYQAHSCKINPDVSYRKIEGIGLLFTPGRASLGYADDELVSASLDTCSYSVSTPLVDFAVGKAAENACIEFVFPNNPKSTKGENYD